MTAHCNLCYNDVVPMLKNKKPGGDLMVAEVTIYGVVVEQRWGELSTPL